MYDEQQQASSQGENGGREYREPENGRRESAWRENGSRPASSKQNDLTRWGLLIGGSALALYGVTRRSKKGIGLAAAGGLMAAQGAKITVYPREFHAQTSFAINCSPDTAYRFWRNFDNLPKFMHHLQSVRMTDGGRSEWTAIGPLDTPVRWTAEIVDERENERIVWRSLPDSDFQIKGFVEFRKAPGGRGTIVSLSFEYELPAGPLGRAIAGVFGKDPEFTIREDLRRLKALLEAGELPTTDGQPHGPRSTVVSAIQSAYPQHGKPSESQISEQLAGERRVS
jgi:uncharacterized membrane protein